MTITLSIEGASAEEIKNEIAKLFSGSELTVGEVAPLTVNIEPETEKRKTSRTTKKDPEPSTTPAPEEPKAETGALGYTFEQIQELAGKVDERQEIKKLVQSGLYKDDKGVDCERMSQIQPKDFAAFAAGLKLIIDQQI